MLDDNKQQAVRCVWVLSGAPQAEPPAALRWVPEPDKVVAADGGFALGVKLGLTPDLLIGDMDSLDDALLDRFHATGAASREYEHHTKPETDTELALLAALEWEPERIVVLGAIGGRLDHTLANVLLLTHPALAQHRVTIIGGDSELFLAKPGVWNEIRGQAGDLLSLLPVGGDATVVKTEGLEYPLLGETLLGGRGRGVSNVLMADTALVWLDSGTLLVVITHK